ncbi:MAG TPA: DUF1992 domain-containing protein [Tepidisphaeraceae bacterium]|jgi:hypothetical protein
MGLQHIDIGAALRRLAERRIEDAMQEGKFDNLAGAGKPLELEPIPAEENARLTWWALRILRNNDYTPDEVRWRKATDHLRAKLRNARHEWEVGPVVRQFNDLVRRINTLGTNAIRIGIAPLDEEEEIERFRGRKAG